MVFPKPASKYEGSNGAILPLYTKRTAVTTIGSPYDCSLKTAMDMSRKTDISESLESFQKETWLLIASFITILALMVQCTFENEQNQILFAIEFWIVVNVHVHFKESKFQGHQLEFAIIRHDHIVCCLCD